MGARTGRLSFGGEGEQGGKHPSCGAPGARLWLKHGLWSRNARTGIQSSLTPGLGLTTLHWGPHLQNRVSESTYLLCECRGYLT